MSNEEVANVVDIDLNRLPYMETPYEKAHGAVLREQEKVDYLENRARTLKEEKSKMITLPTSSYYSVNDEENPALKSFPIILVLHHNPLRYRIRHQDILT